MWFDLEGKNRASLKWLLLFLIITFSFLAISQYFFVKYQFLRTTKLEMDQQVNEIKYSIFHDNRWDFKKYSQSVYEKVSNYYIVTNDGLLVEVNQFIPGIITDVRAVDPSIFKKPKSEENEKIGISLRLYGKRLSDGFVILGIYSPDDIEVADKKLLAAAESFGLSIADAKKIDVSNIDKDVYYAIVDDFNKLIFVVGGLNLQIALNLPPLSSDSNLIIKDIEGKEYAVLYNQILDDNNNVAGTIIIPKDISSINDVLRKQLFFVIGVSAIFLLTFFIFGFYNWNKEETTKRNIKNAFRNYFSPQIIDTILKNKTKIELGGEHKQLTILFIDIRSFTTITEELNSRQLISLLQEYFTEMTEEILATGGVVDKFIGDAIMAFWGAPVEQADHADRAVITAINMTKKLRILRDKWLKLGYPYIDVGIGINTGDVVVGNMGSKNRFDYTVIGDSVNIASRLESLNKKYKTNIIISDATRNRLTIDIPIKKLGEALLKGKTTSIKIYKIIV